MLALLCLTFHPGVVIFSYMGNGFYSGRNGSDQLSVFMVAVALVAAVASSVWPGTIAGYIFAGLAIVLTAWAFFRMFSKNIEKRRNENQAFLSIFKPFHPDPWKYFKCPECHSKCRVPRGKGKIKITCPKCGKQFIRKT